MTKTTKAQIFTAAWNLARQGVAKFGGKVRAYFAEALRLAYRKASEVFVRISITHGRGKNYVALITGLHPKYTFERRFLKTVENGQRMNCYVGHTTIEEVPGGSIIETVESNHKGREDRRFFRVLTGEQIAMSQADIVQAFA